MRYNTGGYAWHSRFLFWYWWTVMIGGVLGVAVAAVTHAPDWFYLILTGLVLSGLTAYLSDRYILRGYPPAVVRQEQRRG